MLSRAIELEPDHPEPLNNRGVALRHLHRYGDALADYNRALQLTPHDPKIIDNRGVCLAHSERYEEALADHNRAQELEPGNPQPMYNRACAYSLMGRPAQSLDELKHAVSSDETYRRMAREDADFDNLRSDPVLGPEFERLVAEPED